MKQSVIIVVVIAAFVLTGYAQTTKFMEKERNENLAQHFYTDKEVEKVSEYIVQQYGEYGDVLHEIVSPDIHCDIVVVPPTKEQPYFKLVTMGAGAYKMKIPKSLKSDMCDRAEYVIFLPKDWNLQSDNEEDFWPIRMLKTIARLTVNTEDWLCYSHTIQLTQDGRPVAENTGFNSCALLYSTGKNGQMVKPLKLGFFGKKVTFYQLYPLYPEELKFKLDHSINELIERLETEENLIINIHRKNYCK